MSGFGFHSLAAAGLFALLAPLIAFYFLKLRRPRMQVPSLVLWGQVLSDQRVNSPFQRFRRHLLLLLQILLLCLLVLAAMRPFFGAVELELVRRPVLVDVSASMAARAERGGPTRLQSVQERLRQLVDNLAPGQQLSVVAFSDRAWRLCDFTDNRRVLRKAIDELRVEHVPGAAGDALRLAQAMGQSSGIDEVLLYSDGNLPPDTDTELAYRFDYHVVAPAGGNVGITAVQARQRRDGGWELLVRLDASAGHRVGGWLRVQHDGQLLAQRAIKLDASGEQRVLLNVPADVVGLVELGLEPDGFDALSADDRAAIALPRPRPLRVLVEDGLRSWQLALRAQRDLLAVDAAGAPDLVISSSPERLELRPAVACLVGHVPEAIARVTIPESEPTTVADWSRTAPLLRHVSLDELTVLERWRWRPRAGDRDLENAGLQTLVHGELGPLLVERRERQRVAYHLLFHSDRSTLPYRVGFPVLAANLVAEARHLAGIAEVAGRRTGVQDIDGLPADQPVRITAPDGAQQRLQSDAEGRVDGIAAPLAGRYQLAVDGREQVFAASLLDRFETGLAVTGELRFREISVAAGSAQAAPRRELWRHLALLAVVLLMVEWWYYQRRPGGWR